MDSPERPGWYDDPDGEDQLRYFDGIVWSNRTVPKRVERPALPAGPGAAVPGPGAPAPWGGAGTPPSPSFSPPPAGAARSTSGPTTSDGQPLASYPLRVLAYLLDAALLGLLSALVIAVPLWKAISEYVRFVATAVERGDQGMIERLTPEQVLGMIDLRWFAVAIGLNALTYAAYHTLCVGRWGATPGKLATGLRVRRTDAPGAPGYGPAFMRTILLVGLSLLSLVPLASLLVLPVLLMNWWWPLRDPARQSLQDKIAGTQVVERR